MPLIAHYETVLQSQYQHFAGLQQTGSLFGNHVLTGLGEVDTLLCAINIVAEEVTFEHDEHA